MNWIDIALCIIDAGVMVMLMRMILNSKSVRIQIPISFNWVMPIAFFAIGLISLLSFSGVFRYIQAGLMVLFGCVLLNMKTGLSVNGMIVMGDRIPYRDIRNISVKDGMFTYTCKKGPMEFKIDPAKEQEFHEYLERHKN